MQDFDAASLALPGIRQLQPYQAGNRLKKLSAN